MHAGRRRSCRRAEPSAKRPREAEPGARERPTAVRVSAFYSFETNRSAPIRADRCQQNGLAAGGSHRLENLEAGCLEVGGGGCPPSKSKAATPSRYRLDTSSRATKPCLCRAARSRCTVGTGRSRASAASVTVQSGASGVKRRSIANVRSRTRGPEPVVSTRG